MLTSLVSAMVLFICSLNGGGQEPPLVFERTVIDLGPVSDEQLVRQPFRFTYTGLRPGKLKFEHCHLCDPPEPDRAQYEPGQSGIVIVELQTQGRSGDAEVVSTVYADTQPRERVELRLRASIRPRVMVRGEAEELMALPRSKGGAVEVMIIGRRAGFEVKSVEAGSPFMEATLGAVTEVEDLGDKCRAYPVHVRLKPGLPLGKFSATLRAQTNEPSNPLVESPIQATVVGELMAEPESVFVGALAQRAAFAGWFVLSRRDGVPLWYGSVKLAAVPERQMPGMALDVEPGEFPGTLKVRVYGRAPEFSTEVATAFVDVSMEDETLRVPIRMAVRSGSPLRRR